MGFERGCGRSTIRSVEHLYNVQVLWRRRSAGAGSAAAAGESGSGAMRDFRDLSVAVGSFIVSDILGGAGT